MVIHAATATSTGVPRNDKLNEALLLAANVSGKKSEKSQADGKIYDLSQGSQGCSEEIFVFVIGGRGGV